MVLISGYCHELRFWKHERFNVLCTRPQSAGHCALLLVVKDNVKARLVLMHGVEYNLSMKDNINDNNLLAFVIIDIINIIIIIIIIFIIIIE